jgi:hypothetical protein
MGALNCRLQNVHTPITGVALSHLTMRRIGPGMLFGIGRPNPNANLVRHSVQKFYREFDTVHPVEPECGLISLCFTGPRASPVHLE